MRYFVDTSAFVAMTDKTDVHHEDAHRFLAELHPADSLHTSNYIVDEAITRIRFSLGHHAAVRFGDTLYSTHLQMIHQVTVDMDREAFRVFKKYTDKEFSFTDCVSFALMHELGIADAFTFDKDFTLAGFRSHPHR